MLFKNLLKLEYDYGTNTQNNGNLRSQKISFKGLTNPFEQTYSYDDLNRLESAEEEVNSQTTWKQTFQYDRYGNRRFDANNTTTLGSCSEAVCNPLINTSDNRLTKDQNNDQINEYDFDKNGNLTLDAANQRFVYDAENHLKEFFLGTNSTSTPDAVYSYDGEGKRVKKISSTEITVFVYNGGGQLVAEYSTQLATTPQVSYLTSDHLGSARVITNQLGQVTTRKDYAAFGEELGTSERTSGLKYDSSETRKGYTGYEKDEESGLEFAQARYYNTTHGRFTSIDPLTASATIKNPQTFNRYSYVLNSPYKYTDPLGLISSSTGACGQWCSNSGPYSNGWSENYSAGGDEEPYAEPAQQTQASSSAPPMPQAVQNTESSVVSFQIGNTTYNGTLVSSSVTNENSSVTLTLAYDWWTTHTDEKGNVTKTLVTPDVAAILNDGLSRIATNSINALIAEQNFTTLGKTTLTIEGSIDLGVKAKKVIGTGGNIGGSASWEINNIEEIGNKARAANDAIQVQIVADLKNKEIVTAWSGEKTVKLGEQKISSGLTIAASFAQNARDKGNEEARKVYNETFEGKRAKVTKDF